MNEVVRELRELAAEARKCAEEVQRPPTTTQLMPPLVVQLTLLGFAARIDEIAARAELASVADDRRQASEPDPGWTPGRFARWLWS
jgi:hypothetical protein